MNISENETQTVSFVDMTTQAQGENNMTNSQNPEGPQNLGGPRIPQSNLALSTSKLSASAGVSNPLSNARTLDWVATIGYSGGATGWLTLNPNHGQLAAGSSQQITVSVINTNLAPGLTHTATVVFRWASSSAPGDTLTVTFTA